VRVFVYEYTCAAGQALPPSLCAEGWAMLSAVVRDLNRVEWVQTVTLLSEGSTKAIKGEVRRCAPADEPAAFRALAAEVDCTLVTAPEFEGILAQRCRWVLEAGGRLLGSSPAAVELTADKLRLADHLRGQRIPTPPCVPAEQANARGASVRFPAVLKPRYGAGSQSLCLVPTKSDLGACLDLLRRESPGVELLLQPLVRGLAASVAVIVTAGVESPLAPAEQLLSTDGRFRYLGGALPLPLPLARRATRLASRAVRAVPELYGYVGVDLVLADSGARGDRVIEINPRLTTSYLGLRALTRDNLAEMMLRAVVQREPVQGPAWGPGPLCFRADGTVIFGPQRRL
jgi:predicted ATP-grasp superfamily ATP-dependent carboligase